MAALKPTEYSPGQPLERYSAERRRRGVATEAVGYKSAATAAAAGSTAVSGAKIAGTKLGQYGLARAYRKVGPNHPAAANIAQLQRIGARAAKHPKSATAGMLGLTAASGGLAAIARMRSNEEAGISQGVGRIKAGESYANTRQRVTTSKSATMLRYALMSTDADIPKVARNLKLINTHKGKIAAGTAGVAATSAGVSSARASKHRVVQSEQLRSMSKSLAQVAERALPEVKAVLKPVQGHGKAKISPKGKDVRNWSAGIVGGSALGGTATYKATGDNKKKAVAAAAGGAAGQGVYQGAAYGSKQYMRARTGQGLTRGKINSIRRGEVGSHLLRADHADVNVNDARRDIKRAHIKANTKAGVTNWKEVHRTYPKALPYHKTERLLAHTHGGKTGMATGAAATIGGASLAMNAIGGHKRQVEKIWNPHLKARVAAKAAEVVRGIVEPIEKPMVHHAYKAGLIGGGVGGVVSGAVGAAVGGNVVGRKAEKRARKSIVDKSLYSREDRPSLIRGLEMGAGLGVTAWGLGRSRMLGAALGRGVKAASGRGNTRAMYALQQAQILQGSLRHGTAPGERTVRRIRALNVAINAVPNAIRPEVAGVAGMMLVSNAHPVTRTQYRPVSTNLQFRRVF